MKFINTVNDRAKKCITDEYRCIKCEAHFLVRVETKLNWNKTEMRTG